jgi:uncharacterized lipoprotein YddW (UPF0748 family)
MPRPRASLLLALALLLLLPLVPAAADSPQPEELRAYWVDAFGEGIYSPQEVAELVDAAKDANMNAIIAQVGRRADCFCNDATWPRTQAFIDPLPYDPLAELIDVAHAEGIEVHAWMNVGTMWNQAAAPANPEHAFNRHGPDPSTGESWLNIRADGADRVGRNFMFDLGNPAAVDYIVEGMRSVAQRYDVDGINLDYVRYPDWNTTLFQNDWGYSEVSLARFHAATGRSDTPEPTDEEFSDWRRDQVTNLVRKLYLTLHEVNPGIALSANTTTYLYGPQEYGSWEDTAPYLGVLQDWRAWMAEGIIDLNVPMNYKRQWMDAQAEMYRQWTASIQDWQYDRHAVVGTAAYLNEIDDTLEQIELALRPSASGNAAVGWTGYSYRNPTLSVLEGRESGSEGRDALAAALTGDDGPFAEDARVPGMPWKTAPTTGHVAGSAVTGDGQPLDAATVQILTQRGRQLAATTTVDGSGWFGAVDLAPGRYRVELAPGSVRGPRAGWVDVVAGQVARIDLRPHGS